MAVYRSSIQGASFFNVTHGWVVIKYDNIFALYFDVDAVTTLEVSVLLRDTNVARVISLQLQMSAKRVHLLYFDHD